MDTENLILNSTEQFVDTVRLCCATLGMTQSKLFLEAITKQTTEEAFEAIKVQAADAGPRVHSLRVRVSPHIKQLVIDCAEDAQTSISKWLELLLARQMEELLELAESRAEVARAERKLVRANLRVCLLDQLVADYEARAAE